MRKNTIKNIVLVGLVLTIVMVCTELSLHNGTSAAEAATHLDNVSLDLQATLNNILGKETTSAEYLYSLDGSADYIYVEFDGGGYAIMYRDTLELLELSYSGSPYEDFGGYKKYYSGPSNYYIKSGGYFEDVITQEVIEITEGEASDNSIAIRAYFGAVKRANAMYEDSESILYHTSTDIVADGIYSVPSMGENQIEDFDKENGTYINNCQFFLEDPFIGANIDGTCGSVATQLLLNYHNYYTDRRIIANNMLFEDIAYAGRNPNTCEDPCLMNSYTLGSTDAFYNGIIRELEPGLQGSSCAAVRNYINQYLGANGNITYDVAYNKTLFGTAINSSYITDQIDQDMPVIVELLGSLGGTSDGKNGHFVVAYGYQNYTYPDGQGPYLGYIVHCGWSREVIEEDEEDVPGDNMEKDRIQVWVNSAWCDGVVTLSIDHVHNFTYVGGTYNEKRCQTCGYRTHAYRTEVLANNNLKITGCEFNLSGDIKIPDSIYGRTITEIGKYAFRNCTSLSSVIFDSTSSSVASIRKGAFLDCKSLNYIELSGVVSTIEAEAFCGCSALTFIYISPDTTEIGDYAFRNCTSLEDVTLAESGSLNSIGNGAFLGCTALNSIELPSSVTEIGFEAFESNTVLTSFTGNRADINLVIVSGEKDTYVENGWDGFNIVEMSGSDDLVITSGELKGDVVIPYTFNNRVIKSIGAEGFANQTELTSIAFTSVTTIKNQAFANCPELTYVAYYSVSNLTDVANHTTSYENYYYTETCMNVFLMAGYTYTLTFDYSDLTATTDATNVFTSLGVGENTFAVDLPVQKTFSDTSGTQTIVFTPTESQISTSNKLWCRFIRTSTPQSVSVTIKNVEITCGVTSIISTAFDNCPKLTSGGLGYKLLSDGTYAVTGWDINQFLSFVLSYGMNKTIFIPSEYNGKTVSRIESGAFRDTADTDDYKAKWIFLQEGIVTICDNAFRDQTEITEIIIPASVTSIGNSSFQNCNKLSTLSYGDDSHLLTIGSYAFADCSKLQISIPANVTTIGSYAFQNCSSSLSINFLAESSVTTIGQYAFSGCTNMFIVTFPASIKTIGSYAFTGCSSFYKIYFKDGVSDLRIGSYAFSGCEKLTTVSLPSDVNYIGNNAFNSCILLETVLLSSNLITIGNNAFANCSILTIYTEKSSKPSGWQTNWNSSGRPVVWNCTFSAEPLYVVSFVKSASNPSNTTAENGIKNPSRKDYTFSAWYTASDFSGTAYTDMTTAPNGTLYAKWTEKSCVAAGTLITLADGTQKAVEELTGDEQLLVWNMLTGTFDVAPILFIDSDPVSTYRIIELSFSDGTQVKVIDEHAFWDFDLNKYVFLREDTGQYIGHWFNKQTTDEEGNLISVRVRWDSVNIYTETTSAWSPVTYGRLCLYVNGMLSMPGATEAFINIFDVDPETMKYDTAKMEQDIATYGLYTYEEFNALIPIPEAVFNAFNGQYLKVAIGKGHTSLDEISCLIARYSIFF